VTKDQRELLEAITRAGAGSATDAIVAALFDIDDLGACLEDLVDLLEEGGMCAPGTELHESVLAAKRALAPDEQEGGNE
jgi:hypothetical protein